MAALTLLIALVFATWFVVLDCKRRPSLSAAVWIPTVVVAILSSRSVSLWLHGGGGDVYNEMGNEAATSPIDLAFFVGVIVISAIVTVKRGINWAKFLKANSAITLFYLYFSLSVAWSNDPMGSLKRVVKDFGMLFVIGLIFTEKDPLQAMRAVYIRSAAVLIPLSIVFIRYFPAFGRVYARNGDATVTGVTTQKNTLGEIILIFGMFFLWDFLEARKSNTKSRWRSIPWDHVLLGVMGLWLLRASQSKTSLLCLMIGGFLMIRYRFLCTRAINTGAFIVALFLPAMLFSSQVFSSAIAPIVEAMGRNMTFTGRASIWQEITLNTVNPLIGCGFWNFWGGEGGNAISVALRTVVPNAHDGYLDIYLDGGFIGLAVLFVLIIASGRRVIGRFVSLGTANGFARISFAVLIVAMVHNLTESSFARIGLLWFTILLMIVEVPRKGLEKGVKIAAPRSTTKGVVRKQAVLANR